MRTSVALYDVSVFRGLVLFYFFHSYHLQTPELNLHYILSKHDSEVPLEGLLYECNCIY